VGTNGLGLIHELLLYGSDDELLDTAVPYLRAGLEVGEPALVSCSPAISVLLRTALGEDSRIGYLNRRDIYATPSEAITSYQQIVDLHVSAGAERIRLVAEVAFGPAQVRWAEWGRYEAVVNHAMRSYPLSVICAYDTRSTPQEMLASGPATHPFLANGDTHRPNPFYVEPTDYLRRSATTKAEPLESTEPALEIRDLADLAGLRRRLELAIFQYPHMPEAAADFMLAIHEVTTNALQHGGPPVDLRLWVGPNHLLCTVSDQGEGFDDPLAGYTWPGGTEEDVAAQGLGLWLARRFCDRVDAFRDPRGFTVRLLTDLRASSGRHSRHQRRF
jgi:anti-sigma regulatory factor (Ser/Thr protein kinase)